MDKKVTMELGGLRVSVEEDEVKLELFDKHEREYVAEASGDEVEATLTALLEFVRLYRERGTPL